MTEMSKKLVKRDAAGQVQRWGVMIPSTGYAYWMFQALAMENGEVLMNADGDRTYYDHPAVIESLQYWYDLSHKYGVMPKGTVEWARCAPTPSRQHRPSCGTPPAIVRGRGRRANSISA